MKKIILLFLLCISIYHCNFDDVELIIINDTTKDFSEFYIKDYSVDQWGKNELESLLKSGESITQYIVKGVYDFKAISPGEEEIIEEGINLTNFDVYTFTIREGR